MVMAEHPVQNIREMEIRARRGKKENRAIPEAARAENPPERRGRIRNERPGLCFTKA
jgi:hypothetical protein